MKESYLQELTKVLKGQILKEDGLTEGEFIIRFLVADPETKELRQCSLLFDNEENDCDFAGATIGRVLN